MNVLTWRAEWLQDGSVVLPVGKLQLRQKLKAMNDRLLVSPLRPSPLWLKQPMKPQMLQRTKRSPAPTVCPRPSKSSSRSSWRPQTGTETDQWADGTFDVVNVKLKWSCASLYCFLLL